MVILLIYYGHFINIEYILIEEKSKTLTKSDHTFCGTGFVNEQTMLSIIDSVGSYEQNFLFNCALKHTFMTKSKQVREIGR